jgi:hypothetical protein
MAVTAEEKDNGEEATAEDATEQQQEDAPTEDTADGEGRHPTKYLRDEKLLMPLSEN